MPMDEEKVTTPQETEEPTMEEDTNITSSAQQIPTSGIYSNQSKGTSKLPLVIVGLLILLLIGGAAYLIRGKFAEAPALPSPSPALETPLIVTSPEPSPQVLDRSKYTLRILNGTSKAGLASSVSAKLKDLGYKVEKTGNATNSAFPQTLVRAKSSLDDLIRQLIADLAPDFQAKEGDSLKNSDTVDAEVILGGK